MAVTEGFEPSIQFPVCSLSRAVVSATHPRHRIGLTYLSHRTIILVNVAINLKYCGWAL